MRRRQRWMRGNLPGPEGLARRGASAALHGLPVVTTTGGAARLASAPSPCQRGSRRILRQAPGPGPDLAATFFGHPRGLATLFLTEMWERFTYYGMRALLVLFLVSAASSGGFGLDDKTAAAIYGLYTASAYLAGLPGGWIADRLIGAQRAVLAGGVAISLGNALLALSTTPRGFYLGLVVIVLGIGLLKPNVSAIVADLYPEGGARLDSGFTIFYIGINIGGFLGPLVTGAAQVYFGLRAGFAAAGLFMAVGVVQFLFNRRHLNGAGAYAPPDPFIADSAEIRSR